MTAVLSTIVHLFEQGIKGVTHGARRLAARPPVADEMPWGTTQTDGSLRRGRFRPDRFDVIGALIWLLAGAVIMCSPRAAWVGTAVAYGDDPLRGGSASD
jgi:hypothetical protein